MTATELATGPAELRGLIPAALARRHLAVAFARQGRRLDVAMINPNDLVLVDEIGAVTRHTVRPHVATESALLATLSLPTPQVEAAPPTPARVTTTGVREWRQYWRLESSPTELFRALEAPALTPPSLTGATFPVLTPIGAERPGVGFIAPRELTEALNELEKIKGDGIFPDPKGVAFILETENLLTVAEMVVRAALLRKESRGPHLFFARFEDLQPVDMKDPEWRKYVVIRREELQAIAIEIDSGWRE